MRRSVANARECKREGNPNVIEIKHLNKTYHADPSEPLALKDINLTIEDGDIFGIIGMSGAGKSTLIRCINLLERPTSGTIEIDGRDVTGYEGTDLLTLRRGIGMVFQDFNLFSQRTVRENITFPLEIVGVSKAEQLRRSDELLRLVGLEGKADTYPSRLSGGQQQRVSIARALANHPQVLLCDEATSALDSLTTDSILKLLRDINHELGVTVVIITHEIGVVEKICNKVAVIDGAEIVEQGETRDVFADPQQQITKHLLGKVRWDG